MIDGMTVVKINALTVPAEGGDELARRFAGRAGAVDSQDGFEGFELLRPTDERTTWLVVTRWRDEAAFQAWLASPAFGHGHRQAAAGQHGTAAAGHHGPAQHGTAQHGTAQHGTAQPSTDQRAPVAVSSELWSFEIAGGAPGGGNAPG